MAPHGHRHCRRPPLGSLALGELAEWAERTPTPAAASRLFRILQTLDALPAKARAGAAIEAVHELGYFDEGKRRPFSRGIVEMLAFAGVLEAPPHVGLATRFVSYAERDARPSHRIEVDAPLGFWTGQHGVNWTNARTLFGLDQSSVVPDVASAVAQAPPPRRKAAQRQVSRLKRRPAEAGDVWSVRLREDASVLVYVWNFDSSGKRAYALVEYLDWFGPESPAPEAMAGLATRPRYDGRWQIRVHGLEKATGLALIAENVAPPKSSGLPPSRSPVGGARELFHLAGSCFPELEA